MPASYAPVGYGPGQAGPAMQMPPPMAFAKGAPFMPQQQQRMEVTVPVPEARVSALLAGRLHRPPAHHASRQAVETQQQRMEVTVPVPEAWVRMA